ncbi:CoxG family protein [Bradyrhizobium pachyrhizi]|uniref:CoxG family protein n=1 Tax=Bradyrhizobium pachyrhizi TaxID=280333 RepID=UPI00067B4242|nr:SRPBCC domain-containing protein [Bradyrhizobium pachyrhizi]
MKASRRVDVPASPEEAWRFATDLPSILPCIPGVRVGDAFGDGSYNASIIASAGDFSVTFTGIASIETGVDRTAIIRAKGGDAAGVISAEAEVRIQVEGASPDARVSALDIQARFDFSGVFALAARASAGPAAALLMRKFAANVAAATHCPASDAEVEEASSRTDELDAGHQHRTHGRGAHVPFAWMARLFRKVRDGFGVARP